MDTIIKISRRYGSDENLVLAGGGNTSVKDDNYLYIKGSGVSLASITADGFVKIDRKKLDEVWKKTYSPDAKDREKEVLADLMAAVMDTGKRPSVETFLHNLFPFKYVVHLHPALVNGLTCSSDGKELATQLFGDNFVWIDEIEPGFILAKTVKEALDSYKAAKGTDADMILLQNHGIFAAADSEEGIDNIYHTVFEKLESRLTQKPDFSEVDIDLERAALLAPAIRMLLKEGNTSIVTFEANKTLNSFLEDADAFKPISSAFTPDHIVYCKSKPLYIEHFADIEEQYNLIAEKITEYKKCGYAPRIIAVEGLGIFAHGISKKTADTAKKLFLDTVKVAVYSESFGGYRFMGDHFIDFIVNWEAESYRSSVSSKTETARANEKIIIVTGSAQGFGQGIAEEMLENGANVIIADLNASLARENAFKLSEKYGTGKATDVAGDVSDEESVKLLMYKTALTYGGIDALVNNAGIVRAGSLDEMTVPMFDLVTKVNYTAYFLCAKYSSKIMQIQHRFDPGYYMDIVQVNSKSGLSGSNKNFAYAGSKFGGIGLTQSFALELIPFNIKVNSVCPGNFLDGPLWTDPEKGLFLQYLKAGKVPGAETIEDVKRFYEAKVPMNRGCRVIDVVRSILYCMEQEYETGQAIPVTGGQEMLK